MSITNITAVTLKSWLDNDQAVLIDVREPAEHASSKIAGSQLSPLGRIQTSDLPDTDKKIVLYCQKGLRGQKACEKVAGATDKDLFNLEGGLHAWQLAGFATEKGEQKVLPLDQQVQLSIGTVVLSASILSATYHPGFVWVSAFFGAGLIFAGSTGFCGLARVLALMPWNRA